MSEDYRTEMQEKMAVALEIVGNCRKFAALIPEVRTNLVYAKPAAAGPQDVLGIDGRITVVNGAPRAADRPKFGASRHMAGTVIEMNRVDPSIRSGINFRCDPSIMRWLENYCNDKGWTFAKVDRSKEPRDAMSTEGASTPWKANEAVRHAGGKAPKIFCTTGAAGKEDMTVLLGRNPVEVATDACEIARRYARISR